MPGANLFIDTQTQYLMVLAQQQAPRYPNQSSSAPSSYSHGAILSRSFFPDLHGQDLHSTPATLASLQAILQEQDSNGSAQREDHTTDDLDDKGSNSNDDSLLPYISNKTTQHLPPMSAFIDPDYFTAAFSTLFPFGIGSHLGDVNGDRPEEVSLNAFARYTMHHLPYCKYSVPIIVSS